MEGLNEPAPAPIPMAPVRVRVTDGPPPAVLVGPEGAEVDLRPALERLVVDLLPSGCYVTFTVRADLEFSFPVERVFREVDGHQLPTAVEIQEAFLGAEMGQSPGQAVLQLVRQRLGG